MNNNYVNTNMNVGAFQPQRSSTLCRNLTFQNHSPATISDIYTGINNVITEMGYPNSNDYYNSVMSAIQPQLSEYINNANRSMAEITGEVRMLITQNQALIENNYHQMMQNERLKKIKRTTVRRYSTDEAGCGVCNESGKEEIKVGFVEVIKVTNIIVEKGSKFREYKYIEYKDSNNVIRKTMIPLEKLTTKKLLQYFKGFNYLCSSSTIANEFLADCINRFHESESAMIPEFPGFSFSTENEVEKVNFNNNYFKYVSFSCNDGNYDVELLTECSEAFKTKVMPSGEINNEKIVEYANTYLNTPEKAILFAFSICGLISSILHDIDYPMEQMLIVSAPNPEITRQACCYLQTYNKDKNGVPFDANITAIRKYVRNANDEMIVLVDNGRVDDEKRRSSVITELSVLKSETEIKPHNIAIISDTAYCFIPEDERICMSLSENFYTYMTSEEEKQMCSSLSLLQRYIIKNICKGYTWFSLTFSEAIKDSNAKDRHKDWPSEKNKNNYYVMLNILEKIGRIFNLPIDDDYTEILITMFLKDDEASSDTSEVTVSEFMKILNSKLKNDEINIMIHSKEMDFVSGEMQIVVKDELILMEECMVTDAILPYMKTTESLIRLEKALADADLLHTSKKLRYPCTIYNNGSSSRKDFIAIKLNEVIDDDMRLKIEAKACKKWFSNDTTEPNMMPLVVNNIGYKAYRKFDFDNSDNLHCFITGRSGSGKTFYITEFMVTQHRTTEQLTIVLDTSGSFTRDSIINNLSVGGDEKIQEKVVRYVDENFKFIDVEKDCIPVNILKLGYPVSPHKMKTIIYDIISASIQNMGKKQRAELKECISKLMLNKNYSIYDLYDIIEEKMSASLSMQFEYVMSPFIEYKADEKNWGEFLENQSGIIVISSDASIHGGSSLVDMLLMSLFYYQCNTKEKHINVVIDEVQNQNCGKSSAIEKILREGRKFHMSLTYATQSLSESNRDKMKTMNGADMKVYFKPDNISAKSIARNIGVNANELTSLKKGECYIEGTLYNNNECRNDNGLIRGCTYRNFIK